jgi:glycosyltransferase involved in cell wall biosynthesis
VDIVEHWLRPLLQPVPIADVTHAVTNGLAALVSLGAKWTYGTPMLLTEHGVYLRERYLGLRSSAYPWPVKSLLSSFQRLLCATAYRTADLITPGNKYNHRWETRFGADPDKIETVYNGVDPNDFPPAGKEPSVPTVTWAGRIDPIKDLETLLRAFALVAEELPAARLRIFGGTPAVSRDYHAQCEALAAQLGVGDAVAFEGRVENIRDAYAAGNVVVLSSISEGFPYTLIEAMVSGRATVSTDVGGVAEAVGDTGVVVPPREPDAMAQACLRLLRDDLLRHRLGAAARDRALANFTVDQAIDAFDAIYTGLADGTYRKPVDAARISA